MRLLQFHLSWFMRVKLIVGLKTGNTQELFNNSLSDSSVSCSLLKLKQTVSPQWVCVYSLMQNCSRLTAELRTGCSSCRALLGQCSMWERWKHDWRAWEWWPGSGGSSVRQSWRHQPIVLSDLMSEIYKQHHVELNLLFFRISELPLPAVQTLFTLPRRVRLNDTKGTSTSIKAEVGVDDSGFWPRIYSPANSTKAQTVQRSISDSTGLGWHVKG